MTYNENGRKPSAYDTELMRKYNEFFKRATVPNKKEYFEKNYLNGQKLPKFKD